MLRTSHGLMSVAAEKLGCSRACIFNRVGKSKTLQGIRDEAREAMKDRSEARLFERIDGKDLQAIMYYLDRMGRDRGYGVVSKHEIEQEGRVDLSQFTPAQLLKLLKASKG